MNISMESLKGFQITNKKTLEYRSILGIDKAVYWGMSGVSD